MEKGSNSESAAISRKIELKNYEFMVENYSGRKGIGVGERITSGEFVVGGHRWSVHLYPQGKNEDAHNAGYVSVFINRTSSTVEPVQMLHDIYFLDQSGKLEHYGSSTFSSKQVVFMSGSVVGYSRFLSRSALDFPDSPYLKHDTLKISVCVGVFSYHHVRNQSSSSSAVDFKQLLKRQWIDEFVFFGVEDLTYCAAKSIIVARCPTLLQKQDDLGLAAIPIPDMAPYIFKVALYFVCLDSLRKIDHETIDESDPLNHESFAAKLLAAADRFEIKGLKRICESSLSKKVSRDSVLSLLHLAHLCNAAQLKSACLKFADRNGLVTIGSDDDECETCRLLFLELAAARNKGVLNTVRESLIDVRESLVATYWEWCSPNEKHKIKMI